MIKLQILRENILRNEEDRRENCYCDVGCWYRVSQCLSLTHVFPDSSTEFLHFKNSLWLTLSLPPFWYLSAKCLYVFHHHLANASFIALYVRSCELAVYWFENFKIPFSLGNWMFENWFCINSFPKAKTAFTCIT